MCRQDGSRLGIEVECRRSNSEDELVIRVQEVPRQFSGLILNAGAYSHTSIALLDALKSVNEPLIEVHLFNIYRRERFRQHSYGSLAATGTICGFGPTGYVLAHNALTQPWQK